MNLIDTHFHLDFYREHKYWYEYINESKQFTLCVTNSPNIFYSCKKLYSETKYLKFALGYNPRTVAENYFDKRLFSYLLGQTKYIGEVGLDFTGKLNQYRDKQMELFDYICSSISDEQILSVHSKKAEREVLEILQKNNIQKAILHWYSGDLTTLKKFISNGYYFSVNSNMINSSKGKSIISNIPLNRILVESDGPFTKVDSRKYNPSMLRDIYDKLGELLNCEHIDILIWNNFKKLSLNEQRLML